MLVPFFLLLPLPLFRFFSPVFKTLHFSCTASFFRSHASTMPRSCHHSRRLPERPVLVSLLSFHPSRTRLNDRKRGCGGEYGLTLFTDGTWLSLSLCTTRVTFCFAHSAEILRTRRGVAYNGRTPPFTDALAGDRCPPFKHCDDRRGFCELPPAVCLCCQGILLVRRLCMCVRASSKAMSERAAGNRGWEGGGEPPPVRACCEEVDICRWPLAMESQRTHTSTKRV